MFSGLKWHKFSQNNAASESVTSVNSPHILLVCQMNKIAAKRQKRGKESVKQCTGEGKGKTEEEEKKEVASLQSGGRRCPKVLKKKEGVSLLPELRNEHWISGKAVVLSSLCAGKTNTQAYSPNSVLVFKLFFTN